MKKSKWEPVIGLEVHVQLNTKSKIFSSAAVTFGSSPNSNANVVDLAMPGTLPVLNCEVLTKAIRFGLAISGEIAPVCRFDRKNYFYPDLPKGYQISQLDHPIVGKGVLKVAMDDGTTRDIGITRAHLEEDAGKSLHDRFPSATAIDLNRAGTPLLEIVTDPDLRSAEEAAACFRQLHTLVTWLDISDGNMNEGSLRCDANVSVRPAGQRQFGERTEIKNINSFRFMQRAVEFEIDRQIDLVEDGARVERETRLYDADLDETRTMRGKELSDDYRYFPDPDLLPVLIASETVETVRESMPELPSAKRERFIDEYELSNDVATRLTHDRATSDYFDQAAKTSRNPKLVANWVLGDIAAALNRDEIESGDVRLPSESLSRLVQHIADGNISNTSAKKVFDVLWTNGGSVDETIESLDLAQVNDRDMVVDLVKAVLKDHPSQVEQIHAGKTKVKGFLVGQVMKRSKGHANPKHVDEVLSEMLSL